MLRAHPSYPMMTSTPSTSRYGPFKCWLPSNIYQKQVYNRMTQWSHHWLDSDQYFSRHMNVMLTLCILNMRSVRHSITQNSIIIISIVYLFTSASSCTCVVISAFPPLTSCPLLLLISQSANLIRLWDLQPEQ